MSTKVVVVIGMVIVTEIDTAHASLSASIPRGLRCSTIPRGCNICRRRS